MWNQLASWDEFGNFDPTWLKFVSFVIQLVSFTCRPFHLMTRELKTNVLVIFAFFSCALSGLAVAWSHTVIFHWTIKASGTDSYLWFLGPMSTSCFFLSAVSFFNYSWVETACGHQEKKHCTQRFFQSAPPFSCCCSEGLELKISELFSRALVASQSFLFRQLYIRWGVTPRKWRRCLFCLYQQTVTIITGTEKPICKIRSAGHWMLLLSIIC